MTTAAGVDSALWITVEITLPELIETPPAFSQRDNVVFCGDESNWQLQKSVCGFQNPPSAPYISDCHPPNSRLPTKKNSDAGWISPPDTGEQVELPFHLSSNWFSNQASSIHNELWDGQRTSYSVSFIANGELVKKFRLWAFTSTAILVEPKSNFISWCPIRSMEVDPHYCSEDKCHGLRFHHSSAWSEFWIFSSPTS